MTGLVTWQAGMNDLCLIGVVVLLILLLVPMKSPQPTIAETPVQGWREQFALDLLHELGNDNPTGTTIRAVVLWTIQEDSSDNAYARGNPLNTRWCNGDDAGPCPDAVVATVQTLTNGLYGDIIYALQTNASCYTIITAIKSSPWAESRYPRWKEEC